MIEARSCERFKVLSDIQDEELSILTGFDGKRRVITFISYARKYGTRNRCRKALERMD
jgi:tRNA isopentenyl-2-thiomethyl-A-37 hydroxylase MiaE